MAEFDYVNRNIDTIKACITNYDYINLREYTSSVMFNGSGKHFIASLLVMCDYDRLRDQGDKIGDALEHYSCILAALEKTTFISSKCFANAIRIRKLISPLPESPGKQKYLMFLDILLDEPFNPQVELDMNDRNIFHRIAISVMYSYFNSFEKQFGVKKIRPKMSMICHDLTCYQLIAQKERVKIFRTSLILQSKYHLIPGIMENTEYLRLSVRRIKRIYLLLTQ